MLEKALKWLNVLIVVTGFVFLGKASFNRQSVQQNTLVNLYLQKLHSAMELYFQEHGAYPPSAETLAELNDQLSSYLKGFPVKRENLLSLRLVSYEAGATNYRMELKLKRKTFILTENGISQ